MSFLQTFQTQLEPLVIPEEEPVEGTNISPASISSESPEKGEDSSSSSISSDTSDEKTASTTTSTKRKRRTLCKGCKAALSAEEIVPKKKRKHRWTEKNQEAFKKCQEGKRRKLEEKRLAKAQAEVVDVKVEPTN